MVFLFGFLDCFQSRREGVRKRERERGAGRGAGCWSDEKEGKKKRGRRGLREQESCSSLDMTTFFSLPDVRHASGPLPRRRHNSDRQADQEHKRGEKKNLRQSHLLSSLVASSTISLLGDFLRSRMAVVKSFLGAPAAPAAPPSTEDLFLVLEWRWLKGEARERGREKREDHRSIWEKRRRASIAAKEEQRRKREHRNGIRAAPLRPSSRLFLPLLPAA